MKTTKVGPLEIVRNGSWAAVEVDCLWFSIFFGDLKVAQEDNTLKKKWVHVVKWSPWR